MIMFYNTQINLQMILTKFEIITGPMWFIKYNRPFMFQKVLYVVIN